MLVEKVKPLLKDIMPTQGPIIIVEDDPDDQEFLISAIESIGVTNEIVTFEDPVSALIYLGTSEAPPFLIFCDINLPKMNGLEFRRSLLKDATGNARVSPFVFHSTCDDENIIREAFSLSIQGYFVKSNSYNELVSCVEAVLSYWNLSRLPYVQLREHHTDRN